LAKIEGIINMIITGDPIKDKVKYHTRSKCRGQVCIFHNPTEHKMRDWPMNLRTDPWAAPLIERMCIHGTGHPDPDSVAYMDKSWGYSSETGKKYYGYGIHGCDGCCIPD
jgi:hypothetical protein